mmetsp:Transcript_98278/g.204978  ORF Transcript_98278/g.204978 Transcript_98278/m.204978 type:complete len:568 (-) Transcript_98278:73-1776(-)|eukprot:CAMPEP_0206477504 /NCGR_PEP_ID=MMETSP0324_2-20121206/35420_1 /ASSEMBLY_ACC=CAM_ASM_000836 /TAXON_ID=2866 /ORGANISM="Crypthecodinium cohnii, Strain Seligo" /LENGTH=567 /DNA_ID=CAMNT_0053953477 /DNA_START=183 /DNA_END=1886 /DNA_ORIENTATION=+
MVQFEELPEEKSPNELALEKADELRVKGNDLLSRGDFADASQCYRDGLLAVVAVGGADASRASEIRLALHLNAALADLKRMNLRSAVDHATGALAIDSKSTKALYRRGLARARLCEHQGHEQEARLALADLEQVLELDASNAEAKKELRALKIKLKAEKEELGEGQKVQFKGLFDSGKPLYEEPKKPSLAGPVLRADGAAAAKPLAISAEDLEFRYERDVPVLTKCSVELREGWCVGLVGNNASGKTTLARILTGQIHPRSGKVVHHKRGKAEGIQWWGAILAVAVAVLAAIVAAVIPKLQQIPKATWYQWLTAPWAPIALGLGLLVVVFISMALLYCCLKLRGSGAKSKTCTLVHITSEMGEKVDFNERNTIEAVISEKMCRRLSKEEKRKYVVLMLKAGGFQMYNQETGEPVGSPEEYVRDGLRYSQLSGGQKHLIYVLRCFASRADVMLCDELLGGLDAFRQPRVLHMLQRLKKEQTAVLYITCELHQVRIVADSLGFIHDGEIVELGPTTEVLDAPKHPFTKDYVGQYRSLPGCSTIGGKLAESFAGLVDDPALLAAWLPPKE